MSKFSEKIDKIEIKK